LCRSTRYQPRIQSVWFRQRSKSLTSTGRSERNPHKDIGGQEARRYSREHRVPRGSKVYVSVSARAGRRYSSAARGGACGQRGWKCGVKCLLRTIVRWPHSLRTLGHAYLDSSRKCFRADIIESGKFGLWVAVIVACERGNRPALKEHCCGQHTASLSDHGRQAAGDEMPSLFASMLENICIAGAPAVLAPAPLAVMPADAGAPAVQ
jgi:hypothetical protein